MAEPSLLCVNCARPPPAHRRTWGRCTVCVERNLPSTYYCGEECMNAHWPKHKVYHTAQKQLSKEISEGTGPEYDRSVAEAQTRRAEKTGSEYSKRFADALALMAEGDLHGAAKAWRKIIKEWPAKPTPHRNLGVVLKRSSRPVDAVPMFLKAMELHEDGSKQWAAAAASAFDLLKIRECRDVPKPEWWNDEGLKALSARVVALAPDDPYACNMRAFALVSGTLWHPPWNAEPRTAAEIKEAATWHRCAARVTRSPADKLAYEQLAQFCDEFADPLLAKEEEEAAKARAAAKAEAAEALKVAEAKAAAAAEELLADEEKEKQQAASTKTSKAKQGKGKKGNGKQ